MSPRTNCTSAPHSAISRLAWPSCRDEKSIAVTWAPHLLSAMAFWAPPQASSSARTPRTSPSRRSDRSPGAKGA